MEVRNRKSKNKQSKKKTEVILHNEDDWDYAAVARKKMDFVRLNDPGQRTLTPYGYECANWQIFESTDLLMMLLLFKLSLMFKTLRSFLVSLMSS